MNLKKSKLPPYKSLEPLEESGKSQIISQKEKELIKCDRLLKWLLVGFILLCISAIAILGTIMAEPKGDLSPFANTAFASKLFDVLKTTQGNVFFSPYSLQVALAMTYAGASGNTAKELQKSLAFPENKDNLYKEVKASTEALHSSKNVTLNIANGMFTAQNYLIKSEYIDKLKTVFAAEAKAVNFGDSAAAAQELNQFVDKNTNGKIHELFTSDAFNSMTKLVLVNAIYFKGAWVNKFDPQDTFKGEFFLNKKDKIEVDYMAITKKFNTVENNALKATIVELPYEGEFSMVLIVPNEIEGIKHLESHLSKVDLKTITDDAYPQEVQLTMPKFKLEQKIELEEPLKKMGVKDMFDSLKAEFGGISDQNDLFVSKAIQKAFIEVNEEGAEAAAATAIKFVMRMMPMPAKEVTVNRPFMFLLRKDKDKILFLGRLSSF